MGYFSCYNSMIVLVISETVYFVVVNYYCRYRNTGRNFFCFFCFIMIIS